MNTVEVKFHEITLEDKKWMDARFAEEKRCACEYTFANNFLWRKSYQVEVAESCGCLVIRFHIDGEVVYSYPIGAGDKKQVITQLIAASQSQGKKLRLQPLEEGDKEELKGWFPGKFLLEGNRDSFDYVYLREKLATLAGKKLHGKRNHIARFMDGDDWSYEPLNEGNLEECREMTYSWMKMRSEKWNEEMEEEVMVLHEAFDHKEELGLIGGVLRKQREIVAFSIGEPLNEDTFVVHFEKAYPEMQGAYPMINQQFVINVCENYTYVNREEDTGDVGLRRAKLSYYPEFLVNKYSATESPVVFADPNRDEEQIQKIWQTCFGDGEEFISFYIEHRMTEENMLVIYEDGKIVSMASFLPVEYERRGEYIPAKYVYGVATLPEYRGRGFARKILEFAMQKYQMPMVLASAEESLVSYYESLGFVKAWKEEERFDISCSEGEKLWELRRATPEEYTKIRDIHFAGEGYIRWDEEAVAYAMEQNQFFGGESILAKGEVFMYVTEGECLNLIETTLSVEQMNEVIPQLLEQTGTSKLKHQPSRTMLWLPQEENQVNISEELYLNLTLG